MATPTEWELLDVMGLNYSDLNDDLRRIASTAALTVPQTKGVIMARQIMQAAERRLGGDPRQLVKLIDKIDREATVIASGHRLFPTLQETLRLPMGELDGILERASMAFQEAMLLPVRFDLRAR